MSSFRGFFEKNSPNKFLRKNLSFETHWMYYFAIVTDAIFRAVWVLTISPAAVGINIPKDIFYIITYSTEVIRRNQWNYYRMENVR